MHTTAEDRRPALTSSALHCCLLLAALGWAAPAHAQLSASVTVLSEYRYRGMVLSDGRPAAQAGLAWDADGGWFAGLFAAQTRTDSAGGAHLMAYGGRTWRLGDVSAETGISASRLTQLAHSAYAEVFAGLSGNVGAAQLGARLSFAPDYFGQGVRTAYGEIDASWPLAGDVSAYAHAGTLRRLAGARLRYPQRADLRAGIAVALGAASLRLALEHAALRSGYYHDADDTPARTAIIAGASWQF